MIVSHSNRPRKSSPRSRRASKCCWILETFIVIIIDVATHLNLTT